MKGVNGMWADMADMDEYREFVRWQLDMAVNGNAMFRHLNPPFYFGEAVALLWELKARGMGTEKCIKVLGGMMGAVDYFRDFILENDPQGLYAQVRSREVDDTEVVASGQQLMMKMMKIGTDNSPYINQIAGALEEGNWDGNLLQLLAKLQVKLWHLCGAAGNLAGFKRDDMN